jgi:acetoin utilization deacetylase AcuC-like enzyme
MSELLFVCDRRFQQHLVPATHPECPERLAAICHRLERNELMWQLDRQDPEPATDEQLAYVHDAAYIEFLKEQGNKAEKANDLVQLDPDTWMSPRSFEAARLAAGAGLTAVDSLLRNDYSSAFVAVRPPGHHALADRAMGFCLFNNIAIAARYAQRVFGLKKILIVDLDVHHGNGTQAIFYGDPSVCFISFHQYPFWPPDTGWYLEDGAGDGKGCNINIPLPAGTGDRGYLKAWDALVAPVALEYRPDLILVSAGYDAHQDDPLGQQQLSTSGYRLLYRCLRMIAQLCEAKVACLLEGGYNTRALAQAVSATVSVLGCADSKRLLYGTPRGGGVSGGEVKEETTDRNPRLVDERISSIRHYMRKYWHSLREQAAKTLVL